MLLASGEKSPHKKHKELPSCQELALSSFSNQTTLMLVTVADILLAARLTISSTTSCVRYCSQVIEYCSCIGEACNGNNIFLKYCYHMTLLLQQSG